MGNEVATMRKAKFIFIGKMKKGHWKEACDHYFKRIKPQLPFEEVILKDAPGHLPPKDKKKWEGEKILEKIAPQDLVIVLDEHGKTMTSPKLSDQLTRWTDDPAFAPCFIIGGAFGLSEEVLTKSRFKLSLSPMTFPHEMARVILLEQVYRALSIAKGSPYHHV